MEVKWSEVCHNPLIQIACMYNPCLNIIPCVSGFAQESHRTVFRYISKCFKGFWLCCNWKWMVCNGIASQIDHPCFSLHSSYCPCVASELPWKGGSIFPRPLLSSRCKITPNCAVAQIQIRNRCIFKVSRHVTVLCILLQRTLKLFSQGVWLSIQDRTSLTKNILSAQS